MYIRTLLTNTRMLIWNLYIC